MVSGRDPRGEDGQFVLRRRLVNSLEQRQAIAPNGRDQLCAFGRFLRQAEQVEALGVTRKPIRRRYLAQPVWSRMGQCVQSMAHRFTSHFESIQRADGGEGMGRISPLASACFQPAPLLEYFLQAVEQMRLAVVLQQAGAKLAQDRKIKAGISNV